MVEENFKLMTNKTNSVINHIFIYILGILPIVYLYVVVINKVSLFGTKMRVLYTAYNYS